MKHKFWEKFQNRVKVERSRQLNKKRRKQNKKETEEESPEPKDAGEEQNINDAIKEGDERLQTLKDREIQVDALLHVLEEYLTDSASPKNGTDDLESEISTLTNAVKKLKREMEGLDFGEFDSAENSGDKADEKMTLRDMENAGIPIRQAIQALDDLSRDVEEMPNTMDEDEDNVARAFSEGRNTESSVKNEAISSHSSTDSRNDIEEEQENISSEMIDSELSVPMPSTNSQRRDIEEDEEESDKQLEPEDTPPLEKADEPPAFITNSENHENEVVEIQIEENGRSGPNDQEEEPEDTGDGSNVDSNTLEEVIATFKNDSTIGDAASVKIEPTDGLALLSSSPPDVLPTENFGNEANEPSEDAEQRTSSQNLIPFESHSIPSHDANPTESLEDRPPLAITISTDTEREPEPDDHSDFDDSSQENDTEHEGEAVRKRSGSQRVRRTFRRKAHDKSSPKKSAMDKFQSFRERHKEKQRQKRIIKYNDELALLEAKMRKERPKYLMSTDERNLTSKMFKQLKALLIKEERDYEAPNPEPLPPLLAAAARASN